LIFPERTARGLELYCAGGAVRLKSLSCIHCVVLNRNSLTWMELLRHL
jgi:hypothetical protein